MITCNSCSFELLSTHLNKEEFILSVYKLGLAAKAIHQSFWSESGRPFGWVCEQIHMVPVSAGGQVWCLNSWEEAWSLSPHRKIWYLVTKDKLLNRIHSDRLGKHVYLSEPGSWICGYLACTKDHWGKLWLHPLCQVCRLGPQEWAWSLGLQGPTWLWEGSWVKSVETGLAFGI